MDLQYLILAINVLISLVISLAIYGFKSSLSRVEERVMGKLEVLQIKVNGFEKLLEDRRQAEIELFRELKQHAERISKLEPHRNR